MRRKLYGKSKKYNWHMSSNKINNFLDTTYCALEKDQFCYSSTVISVSTKRYESILYLT